MIDPESGKLGRTWLFVMTLSWSGHQYVEFVIDQKVGTWLRLHRNAFSFYEGVPVRIDINNLKAAIIKAVWDDAQVQASYPGMCPALLLSGCSLPAEKAAT